MSLPSNLPTEEQNIFCNKLVMLKIGIFGNNLKKRLTSKIILIGASKFVITFQTHDINCVKPVGISEKGTVSSHYLTWFFRLSQIFNQTAKSRKTLKCQLSAPLKTAGRKM